jgi:hypothetical protein
MGLTIHHEIKYRGNSEIRVKKLVEDMRQISLDLPFESVTDVVDLQGKDADYDNQSDEGIRWQLIQALARIEHEGHCISISPEHMIAFEINPGPGSEALNLGLCRYPTKIGFRGEDIKTNLKGWQWSSFCKTQYASNPACGGVANFIKCHVSIVTLLDKISYLKDITVKMNDEGKYGPSNYSDDWKEAYANDRKPTYVDHEGKYSVKELIQEVGEWNEMIAGLAGGLKDLLSATGVSINAPIAEFNNFEYLEFKGKGNSDTLLTFLKVMDQVAKQSMDTECESQWAKI